MALAVEDRLAIMERLSRYNQAIDNFLSDAAEVWADCFTEDGTFRAVTRSGARTKDRLPDGMRQAAKPSQTAQSDPDALIFLRGREQLRAFADASHATHPSRRQPGYHWVSNILIDGDGEHATMTCYLRVMAGKTADLSEAATATGIYRDELSKVDGQWKFASRSVLFDD